jgi:2-polyprenyl-6-hydroxyphenyl methylase/3-demethylubiquinone-9 3-methyltransferase
MLAPPDEPGRYPAPVKHSEAALNGIDIASEGRERVDSGVRRLITKESDMVKPTKNTICLWYDGHAEDAAQFYAKIFPDSSVGAVHRAPGDFPSGKKGDVLTVEFTVMGIPCLGLNGGPTFKHNEAFSFQVATADQAETDRYWNAIVGSGGQESACGWCKDKWGLSWHYADRSDQSDNRSRSRCRQARVRCDDADEKDRHCRNRGGAPRLRLHLRSVHFGRARGT